MKICQQTLFSNFYMHFSTFCYRTQIISNQLAWYVVLVSSGLSCPDTSGSDLFTRLRVKNGRDKRHDSS